MQKKRAGSEEPPLLTKEKQIGSTCVAGCCSLERWGRAEGGGGVIIVNEGVTDGRKKQSDGGEKKSCLWRTWGASSWEGMRM